MFRLSLLVCSIIDARGFPPGFGRPGPGGFGGGPVVITGIDYTIPLSPMPKTIFKKFGYGDFQDARDKCLIEGGVMPSPNNKQENAQMKLFMKKNRIDFAWLALVRRMGGFFNDNWGPAQKWWNWEHRDMYEGPNAALGNVSSVAGKSRDRKPDFLARWVSRGAQAKLPFICIKSFKKEVDTGSSPVWGRPFIFEIGSTYEETEKICKEQWVKGSRYYKADMCMKFFPQRMTFKQAIIKCSAIKGYIPCPNSDEENNNLREAISRSLQTRKSKLTDYTMLKELPEIWLSVKKTDDKWECKDKEKTIGNYWGFSGDLPTVVYNDKYNKFSHNFLTDERIFPNGTIMPLPSFGTYSIISAAKGKWMFAKSDMIFPIVCEFKTVGEATAEEGLARFGENPSIFVPFGYFNQTIAKNACKNRGGVLYNPETSQQRENAHKFVARIQREAFKREFPKPEEVPMFARDFKLRDRYWIGFEHRKAFEPYIFQTLPESAGSTSSRLIPDIQITESDSWSKIADFDPDEYDSHYIENADFPMFSRYGQLRFSGSYKEAIADGKVIAEQAYWTADTALDKARVFCEKPVPRTRIIQFDDDGNPHNSCLSSKFDHVSIGEEKICLHMNLTTFFTWDEARDYCQTIDESSFIWMPYSEEEEKTIISDFEIKTNAIDEEIEEELCGEKRARDEYCSYSSLWSESHRWHKNDPSKLSVPATTIAWIGTEMNFSPERMSSRKDGFMQWVTTEQDREGTYSSSVDRRFISNLYSNWQEGLPVGNHGGPLINRTAVFLDVAGKYRNDYPAETFHALCKPVSGN